MSEGNNSVLAVIVLLIIFVLIPFGMIVLAYPAQPHYVVTGEPVREAAQTAGITILNVTNTTWPLPGATGGRSYSLGNEAGETVIVHTQSFDSEQARDAAIRTFTTQAAIGKGKPLGNLIVIGNHLVYFTVDPGGIQQRIGPELKKKQQAHTGILPI